MSEPKFSFSTDSYADQFELVSYSGTENISKMFEFSLSLKVAKDLVSSVDFQTVVQEGCKIITSNIEGYSSDYEIIGMLKSIDEEFQSSNTHKYYTALMVPALWRQSKNVSYDIYVDQAVDVILEDELSNDVLSDHQLSLSQTYPPKQFTCQYAESNFDFVARLANHWGIYYYFDHDQQGKLIFADDSNYDPTVIPQAKLDISNNPTNSFNTVRTLKRTFNASPVGVVISEINPDQASEHFSGFAGDVSGKNCVHLVNESCDDIDEATLIAEVRLQEYQSEAIEYFGTTGIPCLAPGFILKVIDSDGEETDILLTSVQHSADNLDNSSRVDGAGTTHYEATFTGIPSTVQYRPQHDKITKPQAISTTARIHSDDDEKNIAQRNEVGKYQVIFDFLKDEKKVSHWVRLARHTARTNHFDMPLTPGTEVQMSFVGGNPDKPFIQSALENSQSVRHSVTNANPHHASIRTDGALYTETVKSYQNLHVSATHDMDDVHSYISQFPLKELDSVGADSGSDVDEVVGQHHIRRRFGDRYSQINGVDFNCGLNAQFNFGQRYEENHAYIDHTSNSENQFPLNGDKLEAADVGMASVLFDDELEDERKAGIVRKDFGNKYNYHTGIESNWAQGPDASGTHKVYNFGARYIENHADLSASRESTAASVPEAPSDTALVTNNYGDTFTYIEGKEVYGHEGDYNGMRTGATTEEFVGDITRTITGNVTDDITGDIVQTVMGAKEEVTKTLSGDQITTVMAAGKVEVNITAGAEISIIETTPAKKTTLMGDDSWFKLANDSTTTIGMKSETFGGIVNSNFGGLKVETFFSGQVTLGKAADLTERSTNLTKISNNIEKTQNRMINASINIVKAKLTMIG